MIKNKTYMENNSLVNKIEEMKEDYRAEQIVHGWNSADDAARDIYTGFNSMLLEGSPVFLYKNTGGNKSDLQQVVVVRSVNDPDKFAASILTTGWSVVYPFVLPKTYLEMEIYEDLKKYKLDEKILNTYKQIVSHL